MRLLIFNIVSYIYCLPFVFSNIGKEYGVSLIDRIKLFLRILKANKKIKTLTLWQQNLFLVEEILSIPHSLEGDVVECGCYNGASTACLSLACKLTDRVLHVCDSFIGLPEPEKDEALTLKGDSKNYYLWGKGQYSSDGGLEGVKENIKKYGDINVCIFHAGYFIDTLSEIKSSIVLVFEDADIASSVKDCLTYLWKQLSNGCKFVSHEPWSNSVVALFYDSVWWQGNFNQSVPGFIGSGTGAIKDIRYFPDIGYTVKGDMSLDGYHRCEHEGKL